MHARSHTPRNTRRHGNKPPSHHVRHILVLLAVLLLGVGIYSYLGGGDEEVVTDTESGASDEFNMELHAIDEPESIWFIVNKRRPLSPGYAPEELVVPDIPLYGSRDEENMLVDSRITDNLVALVDSSREAGVQLALGSGFRSEGYQRGIYNLYVERDGQEAADQFSARPRHSEHQTGLAVDFVRPDGECSFQACFADTPEGEWLLAHAHEYGFIMRYQDGMQDITGYQFEPWHFRYVGVELATELEQQGFPTLEEFFGLEPAPNYLQD